ncbi:MAG: enoyl-CoA hydratase-related protein [Streptosporangiaceae bacterium]
MSDYTTLLVDTDDGVATIWLNRPDRRNAFNATMSQELYDAFAAFEHDDDVRVIVVTGSGRYFSAGADLERGAGTFSGPRTDDQARAERIKPWTMSTPIIAAMNGSAVGMGLTLPLNWDVRFMADQGKYGFVFNRRGVIPEANSLWLAPRLVGLARSFDLLLSGRLFSGAEAEERGLATKALPADEVLPAAQELARDIAANTSPVSVAITKRLTYRFLMEPDREAAYAAERDAFRWMGKQPDAAEGVVSFLEKRAPQWTMSKTKDVPEQL